MIDAIRPTPAILPACTGRVEVLHRKRAPVVRTDVQSILHGWQRADDGFAMSGGMHIDLYVNPSRT